MKKTITLAAFMIAGFVAGCITMHTVYYDGEGNVIPGTAVRSLVRSQFVRVDTIEQQELNKYFSHR